MSAPLVETKEILVDGFYWDIIKKDGKSNFAMYWVRECKISCIQYNELNLFECAYLPVAVSENFNVDSTCEKMYMKIIPLEEEGQTKDLFYFAIGKDRDLIIYTDALVLIDPENPNNYVSISSENYKKLPSII
jgi:hypothetical protein